VYTPIYARSRYIVKIMYMRKNHSDIKLGMEGKLSSDLPISLGYGHAEKTGERSEAMQWRN